MNAIRPWRTIERRKSRQIMVGNVAVGGDAPITVQTMTNTPTEDALATIISGSRGQADGIDALAAPSDIEADVDALIERTGVEG